MCISYIVNNLNMNQGRSSREGMGQTYREFSRLKYNKYKHQFPRMRESDIINKIIKDWERLTPAEKDELFKEYSDNKR